MYNCTYVRQHSWREHRTDIYSLNIFFATDTATDTATVTAAPHRAGHWQKRVPAFRQPRTPAPASRLGSRLAAACSLRCCAAVFVWHRKRRTQTPTGSSTRVPQQVEVTVEGRRNFARPTQESTEATAPISHFWQQKKQKRDRTQHTHIYM